MFSKITSDLSGAADCCNIIPPAQFRDQKCLSYLIPGEIPFMVLVSKKDEHMFTNFAYIFLQVTFFNAGRVSSVFKKVGKEIQLL
jgi:hypothetical protein